MNKKYVVNILCVKNKTEVKVSYISQIKLYADWIKDCGINKDMQIDVSVQNKFTYALCVEESPPLKGETSGV